MEAKVTEGEDNTVQRLPVGLLVAVQGHLLQHEHLQLHDVGGGHGHQDLGRRHLRHSWRLSQVTLELIKSRTLLNVDLVGMKWNGIFLGKYQKEQWIHWTQS